MKKEKQCFLFLSPLAFVALSGCSGDPSAGDVQKAITAIVGPGVSVRDVKVIECVSSNSTTGHTCDVEFNLTGIGSSINAVDTMRFAKGSEGWVIVESAYLP
ncbi:hypothetical protein [Halomonas sp. BC04]|uniref:hypothetical protein n=1 Tax=Halomonas sp. BC04 TaxID=1403540 RepID=UPI0012DD0196|nr:hypothetical protein [Halomonas sp. BC04]